MDQKLESEESLERNLNKELEATKAELRRRNEAIRTEAFQNRVASLRMRDMAPVGHPESKLMQPPSVGRAVHYYPAAEEGYVTPGPLAATVVHVHSSHPLVGIVNLAVFAANGGISYKFSVPVSHDPGSTGVPCWRWPAPVAMVPVA